MPEKPLKIIFMGTPEFAVPSLNALITGGFQVVGVITAPDKPAGRGQKIRYSAVKECAVSHGLKILQPTNLKDTHFIQELEQLNADLQIVVAFRMLPEIVWNMPEHGTFNLHASLLPNYRGAAPINWAIINGETETGCTTFFLKHAIDTGDIIKQITEPILPEDNVGSLYERLMHKGARLVAETAKEIQNGTVQTRPQDTSSPLNPAPKIHKDTCQINWDQCARDIHNFVRGLSPYPAAWCKLGEKTAKIYESTIIDPDKQGNVGELHTDNKHYLHVQTKEGVIGITQLQLEGKKRMDIESFLRGNTI